MRTSAFASSEDVMIGKFPRVYCHGTNLKSMSFRSTSVILLNISLWDDLFGSQAKRIALVVAILRPPIGPNDL